MTAPAQATIDTEEELSEKAKVPYHAYADFNDSGEVPDHLFDPEIEFVQVDGFAGTGTNKGVEGVHKVLSDLLANFESLKMRPRRILAEQGDDILFRVAVSAHAKGSQIQVKETLFHIWTVRDGLILRWRAFAEEDEARKALAS